MVVDRPLLSSVLADLLGSGLAGLPGRTLGGILISRLGGLLGSGLAGLPGRTLGGVLINGLGGLLGSNLVGLSLSILGDLPDYGVDVLLIRQWRIWDPREEKQRGQNQSEKQERA